MLAASLPTQRPVIRLAWRAATKDLSPLDEHDFALWIDTRHRDKDLSRPDVVTALLETWRVSEGR
jgi:hypothetical protein